MKRTYDNSVSGGQNTGGQISTGQMATKDIVYFSTNMVNVQKEDNSTLHGIASTFNQTRVLPIVGRTNRAELAVQSIDIQTKTLPIFQPQVQLGTDIDRLIYEVGLSSTWRNSVIRLPPDNSTLDILTIDPAEEPDSQSTYYGESTFLNEPNASLTVIDSYNTEIKLKLIPTSVTNTVLSVLFDHWMNFIINDPFSNQRSLFKTTSLTPVVVPSVKQAILGSSYVASGANVGKLILELSSNVGFNTNDRVRLFGTVDRLNPNQKITKVFATVLDIAQYDAQSAANLTGTHASLVLDYPFYLAETRYFSFAPYINNQHYMTIGIGSDADIVSPGQTFIIREAPDQYGLDPRLKDVSFTVLYKNADSVTALITYTGTQPSVGPINAPSLQIITEFQGGYVINQSVSNGGHVEFLTNEYEFRPLTVQGMGQVYPDAVLSFEYFPLPSGTELDSGFFRGFGNGTAQYLSCPVQITINPPSPGQSVNTALNGIYRIARIDNNGSTFIFYLAPVNKTIPSPIPFDQTGYSFTMKLAPNYYTFDTSANEVIKPETSSRYQFMRSIGFTPTDTLVQGKSTYPPSASTPVHTWTRAYTVSWDFSAYRYLQWITQDYTATPPAPPIFKQDFGLESSSNYYNVYEWNKFISDCVNKASQLCINDTFSDEENVESFSLNKQLSTVFTNYVNIFSRPITSFLWSKDHLYNIQNPISYVIPPINTMVIFNFASTVTFKPKQKVIASLFGPGQLDAVYTIMSVTSTSIVVNNTNNLPSSSGVCDPGSTIGALGYKLGEIAVSGVSYTSFIFSATKDSTTQDLPKTPTSNPFWIFLGYVPYQTVDVDPISVIPYSLCMTYTPYQISAKVVNGWNQRQYGSVLLGWNSNFDSSLYSTSAISTPIFKTAAPEFYYDNLTLLSYVKFDGTGFGTINVTQSQLPQSTISLYNYKRRSWGNQGVQNADEWLTFESNSSFKFLLDNFPSYCISYENTSSEIRTGEILPRIEYWVWDNSSLLDPRVGTGFYNIYQSSESLSSCMSPVQSIVVLSENIPVVDELASPLYYLTDSNSSSFSSRSDTVALTEKIITEIFTPMFSPQNSRSVIKYEADNLKYVSLLDTRLFKQLEYSLYYRHRITQELVPLILSNYGSVNIKFVFRPIS